MLLNVNVRLGQLYKVYLLVDWQNARLTKVPSPFHCDSVHFHSFEISSNKSASFFLFLLVFSAFYSLLQIFCTSRQECLKFKNVHYLHFVQFMSNSFKPIFFSLQLICKASKGYVLHKTPRKNTLNFCD